MGTMFQTSTIKIGFAARQTANSRFSHYEGTVKELIDVIRKATTPPPGKTYADLRIKMIPVRDRVNGIVIVGVPPEGFWSSVKLIEPSDVLKTVLAARREGEDPVLSTVIVGGKKVPAKFVEIVLYARETLGGDAATDADYEIVSINASPYEFEVPMDPTTMARNYLQKTGGTQQGDYGDQKWADAAWFWSRHANVEPV